MTNYEGVPKVHRILALAAIAVLVAGCGASDNDDSSLAAVSTAGEKRIQTATTDPEPPASADTTATTEAPTSTATATTEAPTSTATEASTREDQLMGVVWRSAVDPSRVNQPAETRPIHSAEHVEARVDLFLLLPGDHEYCEEATEWFADQRVRGDQCLVVQIEFDVAANAGEFGGGVSIDAMLTPDRRQIDVYEYESGVPGAVGRVLTVAIPDGGPGSTLFLDVDGETWQVDVPPVEAFAPVSVDL